MKKPESLSKVVVVWALAVVVAVAAALAGPSAQSSLPQVTRVTLSTDRTVVFIEGTRLGGGQIAHGAPVVTIGDLVSPNVVINADARLVIATVPPDLTPGLYRGKLE